MAWCFCDFGHCHDDDGIHQMTETCRYGTSPLRVSTLVFHWEGRLLLLWLSVWARWKNIWWRIYLVVKIFGGENIWLRNYLVELEKIRKPTIGCCIWCEQADMVRELLREMMKQKSVMRNINAYSVDNASRSNITFILNILRHVLTFTIEPIPPPNRLSAHLCYLWSENW